MRARYEKIANRKDELFATAHFVMKHFDAPFHYHREFELTHIVSSCGRRIVGDHVGLFQPDDLVLLGTQLPHAYYNDRGRATEQAESRVVQFCDDAFGEGFFDRGELSRLGRLLKRSSHGLRVHGGLRTRVLKQLDELYEAKGPHRVTRLLDVLATLANGRELEPLASVSYAPTLSLYQGDRINRICEYIHRSFEEPLTQTQVAAHAHMSPPAFSRFFRKTTGKTFTAFLNEVRIGHACRLLTETDRSVLDICHACGFENLSNFNRRFRELRERTPRDYRKATVGEPS